MNFTALTTALTGLLGAFFLLTGLRQFWSDSEIWGIEKSRLWIQGSEYVSILQKPLFHLLWTPVVFFDSLASRMVAARLIYFILLIVALFLICRSTRKPFWCALLILSSPFFLLDAVPVRSDLVAIPAVLWVYQDFLRQQIRWKTTALAALVAVLITPKAFLFLLPCLFLCPSSFWRDFFQTKNLLKTLLIVTLLCGWFWLAGLWGYGGRLFQKEEYGVGLLEGPRFLFVGRYATENILYLVLLAFAFWAAKDWRRRAAALGMLAVILIFPDRLPFFLSAALLVMTLLLDPTSHPWFHRHSWLFGIIVAIHLTQSAPTAWQITSDEQEILVARLENLQRRFPEIVIYDGLGILSSAQNNPFFMGPAEKEHNAGIEKSLIDTAPDILLMTPRLRTYTSLAQRLPSLDYQEIDSGVWVRSLSVSPDLNYSQVIERVRQRFHRSLDRQNDVFISIGPLGDPTQRRLKVQIEKFLQTDSWRPPTTAVITPFSELQGISEYGDPDQLLRFQHPQRWGSRNWLGQKVLP